MASAITGELWALVWDPLELIVNLPTGGRLPLLCWCELHVRLTNFAQLKTFLGKSEISREELKEQYKPSITDVLTSKFSQMDWTRATSVRSPVADEVTSTLQKENLPGIQVERFLIRTICTWTEYLELRALREELSRRAHQESQAPEKVLSDMDPLLQDLLSPEEQKQLTPARETLRRLCTPGQEIILANQYRLDSSLGRGGMGVVWKAWDLIGGRWVAIKFLPPAFQNHPEEIKRFRESFQHIQRLQHQYICPVYGLHLDERVGYFLVMKYVEGITAWEYRQCCLQRRGTSQFPEEKVLAILKPVAEALDYTHSQRIIHRDIKPNNILIEVDTSDPDRINNVQVIDFGLAATIRSSLSRIQRDESPAGTPAYMAPEQWEGGNCVPQTDQYALAVVAYELLSGHLPFPQENLIILQQAVLNNEPPLITGYNKVNEVLRKGLAKEASARYINCGELVDALEKAFLADKPPEKQGGLISVGDQEKAVSEERLPPATPPSTYQVSCLEGDWIDWTCQPAMARDQQWQARELPAGWKCRSWGALAGVVPLGSGRVALSVVDALQNQAISLTVEIKSLTDFFSFLGFRQIEGGVLREPQNLGGTDFCCVPGGFFPLGYHPNPQRTDWLRTLRARGFPIDDQVARQQWPGGIGHCNSFLISRFKVTNQEYAEFVQAVGGHRPPHWSESRPPRGTERHPVTNISYEDAQAYCQWKTQKAQEANLPILYRLPTHWEWEKAARGGCSSLESAFEEAAQPNGPGRIYPWGDQFQDTSLNSRTGRGIAQIQNVNVLMGLPTPWKVCELVGNAYEWVDGGCVKSGAVYKYLRGVPWDEPGEFRGLVFYRGVYADSQVRQENIGFRCVISPRRSDPPQQAYVPLGRCMFVDGAGRRQLVGYRFGIARFAVTNEEFHQFRPEHKYPQWERWRPVVNVSWQEAQEFCQWKTQQEGRCYRLPLRHEWELACRGQEGRSYPWGDEYVSYWCNSLESGWGQPIDVDTLPQGASPEGVYHLCGNVFEWLESGEAIGGAYNASCQSFGAPPYENPVPGERDGKPFIGFRWICLLPS